MRTHINRAYALGNFTDKHGFGNYIHGASLYIGSKYCGSAVNDFQLCAERNLAKSCEKQHTQRTQRKGDILRCSN